jgi:hypothetical protein
VVLLNYHQIFFISCLSILCERRCGQTFAEPNVLQRNKGSSMSMTGSDAFNWFEIPRPFIEPTLRALRLGNTALDALFYDVNTMLTDLFLHGSIVVKGADVSPPSRFSELTKGFSQLDLSALSNPAGSILVVDAGRPPRITQFEDVASFVSWVKEHGQKLRTASVTGVGSSALGSAAFAWNVAKALDEPVVAIVPGYGVADAIQQGLEGWFGVYNWWIEQVAQQVLAHTMPLTARSDRHLMITAPGWRGSGPSLPTRCKQTSNVLHAILKDVPNIQRVFGHSKGGVAIKDAIQRLPRETTQRLHVVTFGCSIAEDTPTAGYSQFLGVLDGLGLLTAFNPSHTLIPAHHSTNTSIPLSMPVSVLTRLAMMKEAPQQPVITYRLIEELGARTTRQPILVARQRKEEGTEASMERIYAYADVAG